jgi:hypothetical protein
VRARGFRRTLIAGASWLLLLQNAWACELVIGDADRVYEPDAETDGAALFGDSHTTDLDSASSAYDAAAAPESSADAGADCAATCSSARATCDESCAAVATTCISRCQNNGNCPKACTDAQAQCEATCATTCMTCLPTDCAPSPACTSVVP